MCVCVCVCVLGGKTPFFKRFYLFILRERGREGEKYQCVVASLVPLTGDLAPTQACALTGNQTDDLVHRPVLNPLSHTSQGKRHHF